MSRMIRIVSIALLVLPGCSNLQTLNSAPLPVRMDAVATLATNDCEAMTAADDTALILALRTATARLKAGTLGVDAARQVQASAAEGHTALGAACPGGRLDTSQLARGQAARARTKQLLEAKP